MDGRYYDPELGRVINEDLDGVEMQGDYGYGVVDAENIFPANHFSAPTWGYLEVINPHIPTVQMPVLASNFRHILPARLNPTRRNPLLPNGQGNWFRELLLPVALTSASFLLPFGIGKAVGAGMAAATIGAKKAGVGAGWALGAKVACKAGKGMIIGGTSGFITGGMDGGSWNWSNAFNGLAKGAVLGGIAGGLSAGIGLIKGKGILKTALKICLSAGGAMGISAAQQAIHDNSISASKVGLAGLAGLGSVIASSVDWMGMGEAFSDIMTIIKELFG